MLQQITDYMMSTTFL